MISEKGLYFGSLEALYEKVSYLSQDTPVFDGTIKENLVFDNEVSEADIHVCLEKTHLLSMLAALDNVTVFLYSETERSLAMGLLMNCSKITIIFSTYTGKKQTLSGIRQPVRQARFRSFPKFLVKM